MVGTRSGIWGSWYQLAETFAASERKLSASENLLLFWQKQCEVRQNLSDASR